MSDFTLAEHAPNEEEPPQHQVVPDACPECGRRWAIEGGCTIMQASAPVDEEGWMPIEAPTKRTRLQCNACAHIAHIRPDVLQRFVDARQKMIDDKRAIAAQAKPKKRAKRSRGAG